MSLRLTWNSVLAIACCAAVTGCAPFKPWAGSKANPSKGTAPRAAAPAQENLEHLLDDEPTRAPRPKPERPKTAAKPATKSGNFFSGDTTKKDAARQVDIDSELAMARLGERRGQSDNAKQMYKQITEKYPEHPGAFHRLGVLHAQDGNFQQAHDCFEQALQIGSPSVDLLSDLGYCYYLQSRYEEAEKVLRQGHKLKPNHESTCNNLGLVLGAQNRYAESLEIFQRVNTEAEAYANLAYVFSLQGDLKNAKKGYVEALTADKTLRPAAKALVQVDERLKQRERQAAVAKQKQTESGAPAASANPKQANVGPGDAGLARSNPAANPPADIVDEEPAPAFVRRSQPVEVIELPSPRQMIEHAAESEPQRVAEADDPGTAETIEAEPVEPLAAPRTNIVRRDEIVTRPQVAQSREHSRSNSNLSPAPLETEEPVREPAAATERPMYSMPKPALNRRPTSVAVRPPAERTLTTTDQDDPPPSEAPVKPTIVPPVSANPESVAQKKETINNPFVNSKPAAKLAPVASKPSSPTPTASVKPARSSSFVPPDSLAITPSKRLDKTELPEALNSPEPKVALAKPATTMDSPVVATPQPVTPAARDTAMNSPWHQPGKATPTELAPSEARNPMGTPQPDQNSRLASSEPIELPLPATKPDAKPQANVSMKFGAAKTPSAVANGPASKSKPKTPVAADEMATAKRTLTPTTIPSATPLVAQQPAPPVDSRVTTNSEPKSAMVINPTFTPSKATATATTKKAAPIESSEQPSQLVTLGSSINTGVKPLTTPKAPRSSATEVTKSPVTAVTKSPATPREVLVEPTLAPIVAAPARGSLSDQSARFDQVAKADRAEIQIAELPPIISAKDFAAPTPRTAKLLAQPTKTTNQPSQLANAHSRTGLGSWVTTSAKSRNVEDDLDLPPVVTPAQLSPQRSSR